MNPFTGTKMLFHPDRVAQWLADGDCYPVTAELDLTNRCTDKCPHCAGGRNGDKTDMPKSLAIDIIGQLRDCGVRGLIFTGGGEPLCHPEFHDIFGRTDIACGLITNGVLLRPGAVWNGDKVEWIRISLDASDAEIYRKTHGTDNWHKVLGNIHAMTDAGYGAVIGVGYLVTPDTVDGTAQAAEICVNLGVDYLQFRPVHAHIGNAELTRRTAENFVDAQKHATDKCAVVWSAPKYEAMLAGKWNERPYGKCYGQSMATTIAADGTVYVCCHMRGKPKYALGNLRDQTFKEIWHGKRRREVLANIDFKDCMPLCRCDPFNRTLWNLKHAQPSHKDFL